MCGRYGFEPQPNQLRAFFGTDSSIEFESRAELKPTDLAPVILSNSKSRSRVAWMRWGLLPSWQATDGQRPKPLINARSETVHQKASFRESFAKRRCLVLATSFCEWQRHEGSRTPHRIGLSTRAPFAMAGIWQPVHSSAAREPNRFCILTTEPNDLIRSIHDRMPVILKPHDYARWIAHDSNIPELRQLLEPHDAQSMYVEPITTLKQSTKPRLRTPSAPSQLNLF